MDTMENKKIFWLRILTCAVVAILVLLIGLSIIMFRTLHTMRSFEQRVDVVLSRVETVSEHLEELDIERVVSTVNDVTQQLEAADIAETLRSLQQIAGELKDVDWKTMAEHMDDAMVQAKSSMETAEETLRTVQETMETMDLKGLNKAIQDLKAVIEPLSALSALLKKG